jgi:hypothetical protein
MIYCGSVTGSDFGKVLVPVLAPAPAPGLVPYPDNFFSTVFQQQKTCTKSCLFHARSSIISRKLASLF